MKSTKNKNHDDEYKEDNSQHQEGNITIINKTKEEEAFIKRFMCVNFKHHVIEYVIDIGNSCGF